MPTARGAIPPAEATTRRLAAARARLLLDHPFLGALVLRLPLKAAGEWCTTTATDARALYYSARWIASLDAAQLQFALAHEALHCALGHFARRGRRQQRRWDVACDLAINPLLLDDGLAPPPGAQVLDRYRGMSAEEIYPCIDDEHQDDTLDEHAWDGDDGSGGGDAGQAPREARGGRGEARRREPEPSAGGGDTSRQDDGGRGTQGKGHDGSSAPADATGTDPQDGAARPAPLRADERERLHRQWQHHLAAAAQRAREAGKLAGALQRLVEQGLAPRVSWRAALAHHLAQTARDDYTWLRPSRREGDAVLPSLRSRSGDVVVAIDTSGSVGAHELALFIGEINALKGTLPVRTTLLACDSALAAGAPWIAEAWEPMAWPGQFAGGGGTDFTPVFEWVERQGLRPDALVYFTDAQGRFPERSPDYPVLWLVKGRAPVPWGRRIALA